MKTWTIKQRIITGFASVLALLGVLAAVSIHLLGGVAANLHHILDDALPGTAIASRIRCDFADEHLALWRNIIAADDADRKSQVETVARDSAEVAKLMGDYQATIFAEEDRQDFDRLAQAIADYNQCRDKMEEFAASHTPLATVYAYNQANLHPAHLKLFAAADTLYVYNETNGRTYGTENQATLARTRRIIGFGAGLAILLGIGFAAVITLTLTRTITQMAKALDEGSDQVASASTQVAASSQSLAQGISEQAASLEETSAALEEMSSLTKRNADNAQNAKELSSAARLAAETGAAEMEKMSAAMSAIKASGDNIGRIIKTIDEIAFQTNILALNAAVEAARAGGAGMGFAVVAEEVRNLAQRSAEAARETAEKIEDSITKSENGVLISQGVSSSLQTIVTKARQTDELLAEIATASGEQSKGIVEVNTAVAQMDKVTQSGAAGAEEGASAAEELNAQAKALKDQVGELLALAGADDGRLVAAPAPGHAPAHAATAPQARTAVSHPRVLQRPVLASPAIVARTAAEMPLVEDFKDF